MTDPSAGIGLTLEEVADNGSKTTNILEEKPLDKDSAVSANPHIPSVSASAVLGESSSLPEHIPKCEGVKFGSLDKGSNMLDQIMDSFTTTGFQATNLGLAVEQIRKMREWRLSDTEWKEGDDPSLKETEVRTRIRARIFLGYTLLW
eukprot:CAMPEP_0176014860 /NCGR_PEP_ID=MMETSP0120_2-20121206/7039_1 /TAXON_ID=160619 /ORGANISM="Kryptoperidinium foliaceum, Strain CCMP 1326" /LENGTH=146 /DNA_ID=CAMNT_0017347811 /DNA_START=37 /DNA_END=474 /DNA_ORIENTATION=+